MLVLTRKTDQAFTLNAGEIVIRVLSIDGDRVKIGIDAPRSVTILRQELCEEVGEQNRASALAVNSTGQLASVMKNLLKH